MSDRAARSIFEVANQALSETNTLGTSFELALQKVEYKRNDAWLINQWLIPTNCHSGCLTSSSACNDCNACISTCGSPFIPLPFDPSCIDRCYQNVGGCLACDGCKFGGCFLNDGYLYNRTRLEANVCYIAMCSIYCLINFHNIYSMVFKLGEIAESSIESHLYLFLTDSTMDGPALGLAFNGDPPKPTFGTLCEESRKIRIPIVAYHTSDDVLVADTTNPTLCKKGYICTGQVSRE